MFKTISVCVVVVAAGFAFAAVPPKSGPQVGEKVPGPFKPLNLNGPDAGKEECLYCKNGVNPVAMVFTRELTPGVVALIKQLDAATAKNEAAGMGSCVIVCTDNKAMPGALGKWAADSNIRSTILATYEATGPSKYRIAPDAAVTVLLYSKHVVKANHSFRAGELTETNVNGIIGDLTKILTRD